jgi:hypothetical protein
MQSLMSARTMNGINKCNVIALLSTAMLPVATTSHTGLAPVRSSKQEQIHASVVSTLLALMDGLDSRGHVRKTTLLLLTIPSIVQQHAAGIALAYK